jgi:hypothetical protein
LVAKGTKTNHVPEPPLITRSISEREKGGKPERAMSLQEPFSYSD